MISSADTLRVRDLVLTMQTNTVKDYVIPGLSSSLVGAGVKGTVRLFTQERAHEEPVCPHSHRFDFSCLVLSGFVHNRIWSKTAFGQGDPYAVTKLVHDKLPEFGKYTIECLHNEPFENYAFIQTKHCPGEWYHMKAEEIHSIFFGRGAVVLFIEGPNRLDHSFVLEPVSDGRVIPTFKVEPWMFRKESNAPRK